MNALEETRRLVLAWRAAKRAAASDDYAPRNHEYARRAAAYALCIRVNVRGMRRG